MRVAFSRGMIRTLPYLSLLVLLLPMGCTGIGEKEAQLEFERLRESTITPQGDPVLPNFGIDPSSEESAWHFQNSGSDSPFTNLLEGQVIGEIGAEVDPTAGWILYFPAPAV
jgi:hypothetical protein